MDCDLATSELLLSNMTDRGFVLWTKLKEKIPPTIASPFI
jgi:hypothetical protein